MGAQIGQPRVVRQLSVTNRLGGARQHRLAAVGQVAQPAGPVDGRSDVVALVAQLHVAGVNADAQPDRGQRRPLQIEGAGHGVDGAAERDHEAVAFALFDRADSVVVRYQFGQCAIQFATPPSLLGLGVPQPGRAFDVGEQQRHRSGRQGLVHALRSNSKSPRGPISLMLASMRRSHAAKHRRCAYISRSVGPDRCATVYALCRPDQVRPDDQTLDLAGALVQPQQPNVAVDALDRARRACSRCRRGSAPRDRRPCLPFRCRTASPPTARSGGPRR